MIRLSCYTLACFSVCCSVTPLLAAVTVNAANMAANGWVFNTTDDSGAAATGTGTGQFVTGPSAPPLGVGSVNLKTGNGITDGNGSMQLRNSSWDGTLLSSITSLKYSTYASSIGGNQLPYLTLYLDLTGDGDFDDRIHFEPVYSAAGAGNGNPWPAQDPVALNTWQTWDAMVGMWYSDSGAPDAHAFTGDLNDAGDHAITWQDYVTAFPAATIVNPDPSLGGIRLTSGFSSPSDSYDTNIDAFTIGINAEVPIEVVYDFEPDTAVPEPASIIAWSLLGLTITGGSWRRRRKPSA